MTAAYTRTPKTATQAITMDIPADGRGRSFFVHPVSLVNNRVAKHMAVISDGDTGLGAATEPSFAITGMPSSCGATVTATPVVPGLDEYDEYLELLAKLDQGDTASFAGLPRGFKLERKAGGFVTNLPVVLCTEPALNLRKSTKGEFVSVPCDPYDDLKRSYGEEDMSNTATESSGSATATAACGEIKAAMVSVFKITVAQKQTSTPTVGAVGTLTYHPLTQNTLNVNDVIAFA